MEICVSWVNLCKPYTPSPSAVVVLDWVKRVPKHLLINRVFLEHWENIFHQSERPGHVWKGSLLQRLGEHTARSFASRKGSA